MPHNTVTAWLAGLCFCMAAQAGTEAPVAATLPLAQVGFSLRQPKAEQVLFQGVISHAADGGHSSPMLYQMPAGAGIVGLFAAILAHGAVSESARSIAMSKEQQAANLVLTPYQAVLASFSNRELMQRALDQLSDTPQKTLLPAGDDGATGWIIESAPVFSMTQDQSAIVLDNALVIRQQGHSDPLLQTVVRVVSNAHPGENTKDSWLAEEGRPLKDECVQMYAHSLHLVLQSLAPPSADQGEPQQKTFRYVEGGTHKSERAQLVALGCHRAIVRTLRGALMSIPQAPESTEEAADKSATCEKEAPYPS